MILHAIELTYVGPFRETVRLGPFPRGLSLVCAPNEAGKSTALRAAARALFDRHTTKGDELKSLQPSGTDLAPRVRVEFETRAGRFRIEKTFLHAPRSLLLQWQDGTWRPVAEADAADQRMQGLLRSSLPGRGATRPEHWGFLGFLWARQGELTEWPALGEDGIARELRARLARVELDAVVERMRAKLLAMADAVVTATGQPRAGGPLRQAEDDLAALEVDLAALRATRTELESALQRHQQAVAAVAQLEKEHAERALAARQLAEQALAAEKSRGELEARELELSAARARLNAIATDATALAQRQADVSRLRADADECTAAVQTADARLTTLREQLERQSAERPVVEARVAALRAAIQRAQGLLRLRQLAAGARQLEQQAARAETVAAEAARLGGLREKEPAVSAAQLRRLEDFAETIRTQRAQLQALGVTLELTPEREAAATVNEGGTATELHWPAGATQRLQRPQSIELVLAGWGRIRVRSGAKEAAAMAQELAASEQHQRALLQELGVASVEAAREATARRRDLDLQAKAAEAALKELLAGHASLAALRSAAAHEAHRAASSAATLVPAAEETALGQAALEAEEARQVAALPAAEKALAELDQALQRLRLDERKTGDARQQAASKEADHRLRLRMLESQIADLSARYADGMEAAKSRAQDTFTEAEARVAGVKKTLPPDFERLPERNRRAAAALQQLSDSLVAARSARDGARGALETLGGQGLYSRETALEEKRAEAILRRDAARARGWSARIAHDLIEHRKQAATRAVLTPLEDRLTAALAELSGDSGRRVFLDERLQIAGVGVTRETSHAFELLSQGAKEQLLLCLRVAVAQELAGDEPQVLILDDVLVNTDPIRQERVLDLLTGLASRLQILVLTCHADRYRGVGTAVGIERDAARERAE